MSDFQSDLNRIGQSIPCLLKILIIDGQDVLDEIAWNAPGNRISFHNFGRIVRSWFNDAKRFDDLQEQPRMLACWQTKKFTVTLSYVFDDSIVAAVFSPRLSAEWAQTYTDRLAFQMDRFLRLHDV